VYASLTVQNCVTCRPNVRGLLIANTDGIKVVLFVNGEVIIISVWILNRLIIVYNLIRLLLLGADACFAHDTLATAFGFQGFSCKVS